MANHQLNITENGKKTLLTAGKYCDRNIDVIVDVPSSGVTPTQFTNILDLPTTIVKDGWRCTSTNYTETADAVAIVCACPKGTHRIRTRGKYVWGYLQGNKSYSNTNPYRINIYKATTHTESEFTGTQINNSTDWATRADFGQDEYGDFYVDITMPADGYIGFNLKQMSLVMPNATFMEPIVTLDEPIGAGCTHNIMEYSGEITETIIGGAKYAVLVKSSKLAEIRNEESLSVVVRFDIVPTAYTVRATFAFNKADQLLAMIPSTCQYTRRWGETANESDNSISLPINTDTETNVGLVRITTDGELRIYSNSNNYAIRPCTYTVRVEW